MSAAANENLVNAAGEEIASWEAPHFRTSSACNAKVVGLIDEGLAGEGRGPYEPECMDFDPSAAVDTEFGITVEPNRPLTLDLQWAEPWFGVESDFFGFLVTGSGASEEVVAVGGEEEIGPKPYLSVYWQNPTSSSQNVRLVIARCAGACDPAASATIDPRIKFSILEDGAGVSATEYPKGRVEGTEDTVGPTVYGHDGSASVVTIGAVNFAESATAPKAPEIYSSRGPSTHYFGPVASTTPAAPLASPEVITKPDLTATDCASTTFFGNFVPGTGWEFCGTSEAVEHAGAIAALMQQSDPFATPGEIVAAMKSTAIPFSVVDSPNAVGAGMIDALGATTALGGAPVDDPPSSVIVPPGVEPVAIEPAPTVTITAGPRPLGDESRPTFEFSASGPVAFTCQVDGGPARPCASPYVVPTALGDGGHGFVVVGTNAQGRSGSSGVYSFAVDTTAPSTSFAKRPKRLVRTRRKSVVERFRLRADESPVTFDCRIDDQPVRTCGSSFAHRFDAGAHVVRVKAEDAAGNLAPRWTVYRFRVKVLAPVHPGRRR